MNKKQPFEKRFFSRVRKTDGCWIWMGGISASGGYGVFGAGKDFLAHRVSYRAFRGPIKDGLFVCHRCDNPPCVNPSHLFLGTRQDNADDCRSKGRHAFGERNGNAKFRISDVIAIRELYPEWSNTRIAKVYGVSYRTVAYITRRETWKDIGEMVKRDEKTDAAEGKAAAARSEIQAS